MQSNKFHSLFRTDSFGKGTQKKSEQNKIYMKNGIDQTVKRNYFAVEKRIQNEKE